MPEKELIQYGVLGVVLILLTWASVGGQVWWGPSVKASRESYEKQISDLRSDHARQITDLKTAYSEQIHDLQMQRNAALADLERLRGINKDLNERMDRALQLARRLADRKPKDVE